MKWRPLVAAVLIFGWIGPVLAGSFLDVRPGVVELSSPPGRIIKGHFVINNSADTNVPFDVKIEDGWARYGQVSSVLPDQWFHLKIPKKRVIRPNRPIKIPYRIQVPSNLTGEVFVLVFFIGVPQPGPNESVGLRFRHGIPVYLSARGTEQVVLFVEKVSGRFTEKGELSISASLGAEGNAHVRPRGEWIVTDFFGQEVDRFSLSSGMPIFPGAKRDYLARSQRTASWAPGSYKARLTATYGELWGTVQTFDKTFDLQVTDKGLIFSEEAPHAP